MVRQMFRAFEKFHVPTQTTAYLRHNRKISLLILYSGIIFFFIRRHDKVLGCNFQTYDLIQTVSIVLHFEPVSYTHLTLPTIYSV